MTPWRIRKLPMEYEKDGWVRKHPTFKSWQVFFWSENEARYVRVGSYRKWEMAVHHIDTYHRLWGRNRA